MIQTSKYGFRKSQTSDNISNVINDDLPFNWDKVEAELEKINVATSITHTQSESVKALPIGTLEGKVSNFEAKGLSLVNSVVNGDFSNGTTGWVADGATHSVTNKVLTLTGNGTSNEPDVYTNIKNKIVGNKYYFYARVRVTNSNCNQIRITSIDIVKQIYNPVINTWYELAGIITATTTSNLLILYVTYPDLATANGKVMEVDGNAGVFAINMTALGIEDFTEAQMLDLVRGGYFEGLKGVENAKVESVGKNLWKSDWLGSFKLADIIDDNLLTLRVPNPENQYTFKLTGYYFDGFTFRLIIRYEDGTETVSNFYPTTMDTKSIVSTLGKVIKNIGIESNGGLYDTIFIESAQLQEGSAITEDFEYKSSHLLANVPLRRLPNGVADRIYESDGQIWLEKNVEEYVLQSGDIVSVSTAEINVDSVRISKSNLTDYKYISTNDANGTSYIIPNFSGLNGGSIDAASSVGKTVNYAGYIQLIVANGTYANLAAAQAALAGTKIHYQLAIPQLINLTEQGLVEGELFSFESGTVYNSSDTFHAQNVSFDVPTNTSAVLMSLVESANYQSKQIASLQAQLNAHIV